jgi:hypothetical protein
MMISSFTSSETKSIRNCKSSSRGARTLMMHIVECRTKRALISSSTLVSAGLLSGALQDVDSVSERTLGGLDVFLPYVKDYVRTFMGKSITTEQWKEHLFAYYTQHGGEDTIEALNSIDWDVSVWFFHPLSRPINCVNPGLAFWNGCNPSCTYGIRHDPRAAVLYTR